MAFLKHALYNPTAILIETILHNILLNLVNEVDEWIRLDLLPHLLDNLLDHMIAIEVE